METDLEFAIDAIFRAAYGAEKVLTGERTDLFTMAAGIVMAKAELKNRGWKWQPEEEPTVTDSTEKVTPQSIIDRIKANPNGAVGYDISYVGKQYSIADLLEESAQPPVGLGEASRRSGVVVAGTDADGF